ncbi:MAG: type I DNA topoisomerase [Phycisphaerae bacterium]|nr:type I DNA topoisomerase [Phycisphaerae bacterium]
MASRTKSKPAPTGKALVIVESPAKAKTINKYLGQSYVVKASRGHVRDLPPRKYGIDPGRNFEPTYEILPSHQKVIDELRDLAKSSDVVYLATDLDREGEAIAWHLAAALELPPEKTRRVIFNEITETAIHDAFQKPHEIDIDKVNAQQARRILDRVVGYELSPLLWKKVAKGLSAGRVQSVAVRLIVEREDEIRRFEPQEYWTIEGVFTPDVAKAAALQNPWRDLLGSNGGDGVSQKDQLAWLADRNAFRAELIEVDGKPFKPEGRIDRKQPAEKMFASAVDEARRIVEALGLAIEKTETAAWGEYARLGLRKIRLVGRFDPAKAPRCRVDAIETRRTTSRPSAPFTTASLQQVAANQLRFATARTMKIAQALYEGIDLKDGAGPVGLITYMRTDSTNLSAESVHAVRDFIQSRFGPRYCPDKPNRYGSAERAQEAHEAIRPTNVTRTPEALAGHLSEEQLKLYTLIWNRFVACQMTPAEWDTTMVRILAEAGAQRAIFKSAGRVLVFDGFYKVLGVPKSSDEQRLPALSERQPVAPFDIAATQRFTQPPARFSEATLVKELEAQGIGRPSTYASIIETIQSRGYVEQLDRRFYPTARGELVTRKLVEHFPKVMDVRFTSYMEDELDKIEEAHLDWIHVLHEFYDPFKESLGRAHQEMQAVRAEPSPYTCDLCGKEMVYRFGRQGRFLACTGYPDCTNAKDVDRDGKPIEPVYAEQPCELCGRRMQVRKSRRGPFLGCTGYPDCSNTRPCDESGKPLRKIGADEIRETCPDCSSPMQVKFARGRAFLSCTKYPNCKATRPMPPGVYVERPKPEDAGVPCDKCGRPMVIRKSRRGPFLSCSGFPRCRNAKPMDKLEELRALAASGNAPTPPSDSGAARNGRSARSNGARGAAKRERVDPATLGPPPEGFAWTRTGRPVVESWPQGALRCPDCGGEVSIKNGRFGAFFGCSKCRFTANLRGEAKKRAEQEAPAAPRPKPIPTDVSCPDCGEKMVLRMGKTGRFLGCSNYPKCRKTMEVPPGLLREVAATAE